MKANYAEAYYNLGKVARVAFALDLSHAVYAFRTAIRNWQNTYECHTLKLVWAWNQLGVTLLEQRKRAEAANAFREALRLEPDFAEARVNLKRAESKR
jgi:tetratricopeptide (TPR) repeat protein